MALRYKYQPVMLICAFDETFGYCHSEFQRHIEASEVFISFPGATRKVMDGIAASEYRPRNAI